MSTTEMLANGFGFTAIVLLFTDVIVGGALSGMGTRDLTRHQAALTWTIFAIAVTSGLAGVWTGVASA